MTVSTALRRSASLPPWLRRRIPVLAECGRIEGVVRKHALHTVCREALCPNRAECWGKGKTTFIILGDICTRSCRFCSLSKGRPLPIDPDEPARVARASEELGLAFVIVTSVTRDDLADGGARTFAATIRALKELPTAPVVEVLVPDFSGDPTALREVVTAGPDIISHNLETIRRLYGRLRSGADYDRSLRLLAEAKRIAREGTANRTEGNGRAQEVMTKSALILGLGETEGEVLEALRDLRRADCDFLAVGQYLQPGMEQAPVAEFIPPERFSWYEKTAYRMGFRDVSAGPLVRSSYHENRVGGHAHGRAGKPGGCEEENHEGDDDCAAL